MAKKPAVVCRALGCSTATKNADGYCDSCKPASHEKRRKKKGNPFYWSTKWKKFRDMYKKKNPLCEECLEHGLLVPVDVVDHIKEIKDGGAKYSKKNAKSLCYRCHAKKTAIEKKKRVGLFESSPTPGVQPFGSQKLPVAKLEGGGIGKEGNYGKR